jgi:sulfonate transport system ATP-binding protein
MFQDARLLPWKKVIDNVGLGLPATGASGAGSLEAVGLADRANEWPAACPVARSSAWPWPAR